MNLNEIVKKKNALKERVSQQMKAIKKSKRFKSINVENLEEID